MTVLALDTSTNVLSLALSHNEQILVREYDDLHSHEERLQILLDELFAAAGISADEISQVLIGLGPGSFTGLRVGLSFVKGLCLARQIPVFGYLSPSAFAAAAASDVFVVSDARREEVFLTECGREGSILAGPDIESVANLAARLKARPDSKLICSGRLELQGFDCEGLPLPGAEPARGLLRLFSGGVVPWTRVLTGPNYVQQLAQLSPFYVRLPSAKTIAERNSGC